MFGRRVILKAAPNPALWFVSSAPMTAMNPLRGSLAHRKVCPSAARGLLSSALAFSLLLGPDFKVTAASAAPRVAINKKLKPDSSLKGLPITDLSADEAIVHALNRLAYGPRPGDVERVKQMGLAKWIDQQLNPSSIDDSAV